MRNSTLRPAYNSALPAHPVRGYHPSKADMKRLILAAVIAGVVVAAAPSGRKSFETQSPVHGLDI